MSKWQKYFDQYKTFNLEELKKGICIDCNRLITYKTSYKKDNGYYYCGHCNNTYDSLYRYGWSTSQSGQMYLHQNKIVAYIFNTLKIYDDEKTYHVAIIILDNKKQIIKAKTIDELKNIVALYFSDDIGNFEH